MIRSLLCTIAMTTLATVMSGATPRPNVTKPAPPSDLTAPPSDALHSADGLVTRALAAGAGEHPGPNDFVHVRYSVWRSPDGEVVDFTRSTSPAFVALDKLLPGMREMLLTMSPGEKRRGWIPSDLGGGKIPSGSSFVVDLELVDVVHPPAAPPDVAAIPDDAKLTPSGLGYRVLRPGTGTVHPTRRNTVIVHYSGWTIDGRMFDSSVLRDEPAAFPMLSVIPGWTEGLQLMTVGEKMRFWIPSNLAYRNEEGKPKGMLVFDVDLLDIK